MTLGAILGMVVFNFLIPLVFAVLFVVFLWGAFYYIIAGGHDEEAREKGKALLLYGFIGFFVLVLFWSFASAIGNSFS